MNDRQTMFFYPIKVDCINPKVTLSTDKRRAEVTFEQYWRSNTYADQGDKKMIFTETNGKWQIIFEDMLTSQKWDRLKFRDGSLATAGPQAVKLGRLRLKNALHLRVGSDRPVRDLFHDYCRADWDGRGRTPKLRGYRVTVKPPKGVEVAGYRYHVRGSTSYSKELDEEGRSSCLDRRLKSLGRGEVQADGNTIDIAIDEETTNWPCAFVIDVKAIDAEGVPLAKGRLKDGIECGE